MIDCTFKLNDEPLSDFVIQSQRFAAFSGRGTEVNRRRSQCVLSVGAIPTGTYYICNRESGGIIGPIIDRMKDKDKWFALYAEDGVVDDKTFCEGVERGQFRLHPNGTFGISEGCIVIHNPSDFEHIRAMILAAAPFPVPGTKHKALGKVVVR